MHHRIYTEPRTCINETWNSVNGKFDSTPGPKYQHPLIEGIPKFGLTYNIKDYCKHKDASLTLDFYKNFAIDIVTETVFDYPYPMLTEKIIRAIVNKKIFIIVGAAKSLELLQTKGFKTFSPFIDESYDQLTDPNDRMETILSEIKRINVISLDTIKDAMLQYTPILEFNFKHYRYLCESELCNL